MSITEEDLLRRVSILETIIENAEPLLCKATVVSYLSKSEIFLSVAACHELLHRYKEEFNYLETEEKQVQRLEAALEKYNNDSN